MEIARSRLTQEGGDLGKQVEEYESKITVLLKGKKTLEQAVEELKRQNEEEVRVSFLPFPFQFPRVIHTYSLLTKQSGLGDETVKRSVTDFNWFLNSQNLYLCRRKPKNDSPFFLTIAILEH